MSTVRPRSSRLRIPAASISRSRMRFLECAGIGLFLRAGLSAYLCRWRSSNLPGAFFGERQQFLTEFGVPFDQSHVPRG